MTTDEFQSGLKKTIESGEYLNYFYEENLPKYHLARPGLDPPIKMTSKFFLWWGRLKLKIREWKLIFLSRL